MFWWYYMIIISGCFDALMTYGLVGELNLAIIGNIFLVLMAFINIHMSGYLIR